MSVPMLIVHIVGGSVALLSGGAALVFRKGGRLHGLAGTIFFVAMMALAASGAAMAGMGSERGTMVIGILTFYLVVTSWATARRRDGNATRFELLAFAVASSCAIAFIAFGVLGMSSPKGRFDSLPAAIHFPFAALAALGAFTDLRFYRRGSLAKPQRISRHLWRMCAALLIAAFSFFLGQQKVMPLSWRGSPLLFLPELAVLGAMIFWLVRVRYAKAFRHYPLRSGAN